MMKQITALAALSMAGLAMAAAPAQAADGLSGLTGMPSLTGGQSLTGAHGVEGMQGVDGATGQADGTGFFGSQVTTADLCHKDLEQYPLVGPLADHTTGVCEALGTTVDQPGQL